MHYLKKCTPNFLSHCDNRVWTLSLCAHYFSVGKAKDPLYLRGVVDEKVPGPPRLRKKKRGGEERERVAHEIGDDNCCVT